MKNKIFEAIIIILASYEAIVTALIFLLYLLFTEFYIVIGELLIKTPTIFELLNYFIGGTLLFAIPYSWKILKPKENNKALYEWEEYWKIKMVVYISLIIIFFCNVSYYLAYVFRQNVNQSTLALIIMLVVINPIITIINLFMAAFKINEIIDETL